MSDLPASGVKPGPVNLKSGNIEAEWTKFKQKFDLYLIGTEQETASSKVKFAQMLSIAGDDALEVYDSFKDKLILKTVDDEGVVTTTDNSQNFAIVLAEFDKYAKEQMSLTACRENFNKRNQKATEPFANWLTDLKNRIQHCEYKDIEDSMLKDRIVWGVYDKRLRETLRSKPNLSLQEVIDVCKGVEATLRQDDVAAIHVETVQAEATRGQNRGNRRFRGRGFRGGRFQSGRVTKSYPGRGQYRGRRPFVHRGTTRGAFAFRGGKQSSAAYYQCRKCNRWHEAANCPAYGQQCNKCGDYNHFAVICRNGANNSSGAHIGNGSVNNPHQNQNNNKTIATVQVKDTSDASKFVLDKW